MTPEEIQQVRERCDALGYLPWEEEISDSGDVLIRFANGGDLYFGNMEGSSREDHANQHFIAAAPTDMRALLAHIASVEAERDGITRFLNIEKHFNRELVDQADRMSTELRDVVAERDEAMACNEAMAAVVGAARYVVRSASAKMQPPFIVVGGLAFDDLRYRLAALDAQQAGEVT